MHELIGSIEDIDVSEISPSEYAVRSVVERVDEFSSLYSTTWSFTTDHS